MLGKYERNKLKPQKQLMHIISFKATPSHHARLEEVEHGALEQSIMLTNHKVF